MGSGKFRPPFGVMFHFIHIVYMPQDGEVTDSKCEDDITELEEREQILQEVHVLYVIV